MVLCEQVSEIKYIDPGSSAFDVSASRSKSIGRAPIHSKSWAPASFMASISSCAENGFGR